MGRLELTIAALSTPAGESGIAVIRISGPQALSVLSTIYRRSSGKPASVAEFEHRRLYHGVLVRPQGEVIDEVVCSVMKGPGSYTGEDVVEISCHGSTLIVEQILDLLFSSGAREAEAGEFTKRAFLNGKIDLIQAEAVCDLIRARSELQRKVAREQMAGSLSAKIHKLAGEMLSLLGEVEASIDFIEEDIEPLDSNQALALIERHVGTLDGLLEGAAFSRPFREGYRVAITGPVNAGKSSVFNRILGERRAIVTEIPGTTRDVLREPVVLGGLLFLFQDMAGLREKTGDKIEAIGMGLAQDATEMADIVVFVLDAAVPIEEDVWTRIERLASERTLMVLNKIDLPAAVDFEEIKRHRPDCRFKALSAKTGEGFEEFKKALLSFAGEENLNRVARERIVLNSRLIRLLKAARESCLATAALLRSGKALEILAVEIREVLANYEEATGRRYSEDLLENIFSRFCIGK